LNEILNVCDKRLALFYDPDFYSSSILSGHIGSLTRVSIARGQGSDYSILNPAHVFYTEALHCLGVQLSYYINAWNFSPASKIKKLPPPPFSSPLLSQYLRWQKEFPKASSEWEKVSFNAAA